MATLLVERIRQLDVLIHSYRLLDDATEVQIFTWMRAQALSRLHAIANISEV